MQPRCPDTQLARQHRGSQSSDKSDCGRVLSCTWCSSCGCCHFSLFPHSLSAFVQEGLSSASDSESSEPPRRVKRRTSSVSGEDWPREGYERKKQQVKTEPHATDNEQARELHARRLPEDVTGLQHNGVSLPGGASSNFHQSGANFVSNSLAAHPGTFHYSMRL